MDTTSHEHYELAIQCLSDGSYAARFLDLPGMQILGRTQKEVFALAESAFASWIERATSLGISIPEPGSHRSVNGVIRIKIARTLHRKIGVMAKSRNISIRALVTSMLSAATIWLFDEQASLEVVIGKHRQWSQKNPCKLTGDWVQKIPPDLHFVLLLMAEKERLSVSALSQYLLGRVVWANFAD